MFLDKFAELMPPNAGVVNIGRSMQGEVAAGSFINPVHLAESAGLFVGHTRYLRFIGVESCQRFLGSARARKLMKRAHQLLNLRGGNMTVHKASATHAFNEIEPEFSMRTCAFVMARLIVAIHKHDPAQLLIVNTGAEFL